MKSFLSNYNKIKLEINRKSYSNSKFQNVIIVQVEKILKINKRAGWNKNMQVGIFGKKNKMCCMFIR